MEPHRAFIGFDRAVIGLCAVLSFAGCATATKPAKAPPLKPFPKDKPLPPLATSCSTEGLVGCETIEELRAKTNQYNQIHREQMVMLERLALELARLLSVPAWPPYASIESEPIVTDQWSTPKGVYPATLTVRLDYIRGLDRINEDNYQKRLKATISDLKKRSEMTQDDWKKLVQELKVDVPKAILQERQMTEVQASFIDEKVTFTIPSRLAVRYFNRDAKSWTAVASHVTKEGNLDHVLVQAHELALTPALVVKREWSEGKLQRVSLLEGPAARQKKTLTSQIPAEKFCNNLRGELRFVPTGESLPMKVFFSPSQTSGGVQ